MFLPHRISDFRDYFNGRLHKRIPIYRWKFWIELVNNFFQVNSYQTGPIWCLWQNKAMPALIRQLRSHAELKQIMVTLNYFFLGWMRWQPSSSSGAKKNSFFHSFTLQTSFNQWDGKLHFTILPTIACNGYSYATFCHTSFIITNLQHNFTKGKYTITTLFILEEAFKDLSKL